MSNLKDTVIWFFSVGMVGVYRVARDKESLAIFKNWISDNFKILIVIEFIVSRYTLPFWGEFVLTPIAALLGYFVVLFSKEVEHKKLGNILNALLIFIGASLAVYSVVGLIKEFDNFATIDTALEFALPGILSLLIMPLFYGLYLFVNFERFFARINIAVPDADLYRYARFKAALCFRLDFDAFKRWTRNIMVNKPQNREDVDNSICVVVDLKKRETLPPPKEVEGGWWPYLAKEFLSADGLPTDDYHSFGGSWFASSYLKIGEGVLINNIQYHVEGGETVVKILSLELNVNHLDEAKVAEALFELLIGKILLKALPSCYGEEISLTENSLPTKMQNTTLSLTRQDWQGGRAGYTKKLTIKHI